MNKNKHDHKATKKLKVFLFALFMILPFLVWIPNAFYYGFNAQAQASERIEENYYLNNQPTTPIQTNTIYYAVLTNFTNDIENQTYNFDYLEIIDDNGATTEIEINNSSPKITYNDDDTFYLYDGTHKYFVDDIVNVLLVFIDDDYSQLIGNTINIFSSPNILIPNGTNTIYTNSITDSMSIAWQQTWSNPLFSWNNSNPLLEPLTNFTNVFGITTDSCIPQALCYLATITMIYVVFDIIIELFTKLTHLINRSD